jgi:hypothetical protein
LVHFSALLSAVGENNVPLAIRVNIEGMPVVVVVVVVIVVVALLKLLLTLSLWLLKPQTS